jgi:ketosteroid isomerase-like protein
MTPQSTSAQTSLAVARRLYELATAGDIDGLAQLWADDATIVEAEDHPFAGRYTGKAELLRMAGVIMGGLGMTAIEVLELIANHNQVCARLAVTFTNAAGTTITREVTEISTINDAGKVLEIRPFYSNLPALKAHLGL